MMDGAALLQADPRPWLDLQSRVMAVALGLAALSFLLTLLIGRWLVPYLRAMKIGKHIREDEPTSHQVKAGTPTMGGLMIIGGAAIVTAIFNLWGNLSMLLPLAVLLATGLLGAIDDRGSLIGNRGTGLRARTKIVAQLAVAVVAAWALHGPLGLNGANVPLLGRFEIGWLYPAIAVVFIVGFSNAVNLTDGLDTLAGGTALIAFVAYGVIAFLQGQPQVLTLCFTVAGALLAFLWFNAHPAQVFMGDTGSLALGAVLAVAAFQTGQWLLLPIIGVIFVAEALSVIMQVAYFKATKGKRIFKMSPIHYHFELGGWAETQVTLRFWIVGIIAAFLGIALALW